MASISREILMRENGNPYFRVEVYDDLPYLKCWWVGYTDVAQVKEGSELLLHFFNMWGRTGLLVDSTAEEGPWNDSNNWIINDWMPRAFASGLQKIAIVLSSNIFSVISAREHSESAKAYGFWVEVFENESAAIKWLIQGKTT